MTQKQDLEFVYAEIKHHLDNVLADETITTIIQMLKEYPKLKEQSQMLESMSRLFIKWNTNKINDELFAQNIVKEMKGYYVQIQDELDDNSQTKGRDGK